MSEREYLIAKGLPRALKTVSAEAGETGLFQPNVSAYAMNRVNSHAAGRLVAAGDSDALELGRGAKEMNHLMLSHRKRQPRLSDIHRENQKALRARRKSRKDELSVSSEADKFLRTGGV